jgi:glycosyltransferase involved in cell wall biosynthesis
VATVKCDVPTFSVVMPAHNASATIETAIRSILLQSVGDFELFVIDDGSTDDTAARASSLNDSRIHLLRQDRAGPSAARNAGIAEARARFVSMIDSDDLWMPRYLETMGKALENDTDAGLAYADAWVLDDWTGRIGRKTIMDYQHPDQRPADGRAFVRRLVDENFVFGLATVRRAVLEQVGAYDERLGYGEDFELWLRIFEAGFGAVRVPAALAVYRKHPGSRTHDAQRAHEGVCKTYGVIVDEHPLDDETRAIARARYEWWLKQRELVANPSFARRIRKLGGRVQRRMLTRTLWLPEPPAEVAETLRACGFNAASSNSGALPTRRHRSAKKAGA